MRWARLYECDVEGPEGPYMNLGRLLGTIVSRIFHNHWRGLPDLSAEVITRMEIGVHPCLVSN